MLVLIVAVAVGIAAGLYVTRNMDGLGSIIVGPKVIALVALAIVIAWAFCSTEGGF